MKEYNQAFGSRPKIPRTPDVSSLGKPSDSASQGRNSQQSLGKLSQHSQGRSSLQSQGKTSQSKVPRTPDSGKRPTSRGSISGMPPPQPQYSESGPRPSSAGKSGKNGQLYVSTSYNLKKKYFFKDYGKSVFWKNEIIMCVKMFQQMDLKVAPVNLML